MTPLEKAIFKRVNDMEKGLANEQERGAFYSMVRDLTMVPLKKEARRKSGLARFERVSRRCVYPDGPHPKLAYLTSGEPEYDERRRLEALSVDLCQTERLKLCGD